MSATIRDQLDNRLTGRWLMWARGLWIVVVALALGVYLFSIPLQFAYYQVVCSGAACPGDQISPTALQQLQQAGLSPAFYAGYFTALNAMLVLVFSIVAAVIFWRKSDDRMGLFASLTLILFGSTFNANALPAVGQQSAALLILSSILSALAASCFFIFFYLFPDGGFVPRWTVWLVPFVVVHEAVFAFRPGTDWFVFFEMASILFAQIYRYWRVSNAVQRQQTKWVVFGAAGGVGGLVALLLLSAITAPPAGSNIHSVVSDIIFNSAFDLFILLIPLAIGMAILRARLWDIDLLIRRTLVYTALTGLLALAYFASVLVLEAVVRLVTGQTQSQVVTVVSTLAIAALFIPLRRWVQAFIDRRFYRRKYDAARTLAAFSSSVRDEVELGRLTDSLTEVVEQTLQPESVSLWIRGQPAAALNTGQGGAGLPRDR